MLSSRLRRRWWKCSDPSVFPVELYLGFLLHLCSSVATHLCGCPGRYRMDGLCSFPEPAGAAGGDVTAPPSRQRGFCLLMGNISCYFFIKLLCCYRAGIIVHLLVCFLPCMPFKIVCVRLQVTQLYFYKVVLNQLILAGPAGISVVFVYDLTLSCQLEGSFWSPQQL